MAEHARSLVVRFVQQLARRAGDDGMHTGFAQVRRRHHRGQGLLDRARRIGEERRHTGKGFVRLGVEDMQDRADQQRVRGLLPMVPALETAFGIDQHVGDILHVAHLPLAAPYFQQRVVGGRRGVGRIEQQHSPMPRAEAGGELPVLALDVVDDRGARPGQQRRYDQSDALARTGRREAQHMLGAIVAQIVGAEPSQHNAIGPEQPGGADFLLARPARRAIGFGVPQLAGAPHRHADGDGDRYEPARGGDERADLEDVGRIGVEAEPPPEEGRRGIDAPAKGDEPRRPKLGLIGERGGGPLRRAPYAGEHYQEHGDDLAP
jgi:hypothetical protein